MKFSLNILTPLLKIIVLYNNLQRWYYHGGMRERASGGGTAILGSLRNQNGNGNVAKPRKGLMSRTIAVHVRYKSLYISLPSSS